MRIWIGRKKGDYVLGMKGFLSMTNIVILLVLMILLGGTVVGIIEDAAYVIACGGCKEGTDAFLDGLGSVVSAGQHDVKLGVDGLLEMKNMTEEQSTVLVDEGLNELYKQKILFGSLLTIAYIFIFYIVINKISEWLLSGLTAPTFWAIVFSMMIVGVLHMIATGFTEFPYQGWVHLAYHPDIWAVKFTEIISPVPIEALNQSLLSNVTGR